MYSDATIVEEPTSGTAVFYSAEEDCYIPVVYCDTSDFLAEYGGYRVPSDILQKCVTDYDCGTVVIVDVETEIWSEFEIETYLEGQEVPSKNLIPAIAGGGGVSADIVVDITEAIYSGNLPSPE